MRGLQCYPSAQELSTELFLDFCLPCTRGLIIALTGSIFQGSTLCAGGHCTAGEAQQNRRCATLQVQPMSVLISHLFLWNWHSSISILNFAEEIFFPGMLLHKQKRWKSRAASLWGNALPCVDGEMPHVKFRERSTSTRILWQFIVLETRMKNWLWDSPADSQWIIFKETSKSNSMK